MIGYVTLGTNDMARAAKFYDALLAEVGGARGMESERFISWSAGPASAGIGVIKPLDGNAATVGNGSMVAIHCSSPDKVKSLYDKAMTLGGKDEGPPGYRFPKFFAAYFRDLDGNKLNAFCMES
jgi:predicted lactoylglutathione lyase